MGKASTYQRRARDFAQRADWDAALTELRQAVSADPGNPMLQNQMGDLFLRKEEVNQACQHFEKAIELYASLGLHNNAVALCRKVIRLCPSRLEVRYQLACLRHEQGLRSEATAFFVDYFDHLPSDGDAALRILEERSTEVLESYPESAPVGKVLEKLEEARAFVCAFDLVQRLAQRAADSGDDEAARRYTTKMRSLKVLVESHGGHLPEKNADTTRAAIETAPSAPGEDGATHEEPRREAEPGASSWMEPSAVLDTPSLEVPASMHLEVPDSASSAGPGGVASSVPEHNHAAADPGEDASDDSLPELDMAALETVGSEALQAPGDAEGRATQVEAGVEEADSSPEYEIPETTLDDVAALWEEEATAGEASMAEAREDPVLDADVPDSLPELEIAMPSDGSDGGADGGYERAWAKEERYHIETDSTADASPWSESPVSEAPPLAGEFESSRETADATELPATTPDWMQEITPPQTTARWQVPSPAPAPASPAGGSPLRESVWVPDEDWNDPNQLPKPDSGSTHELAEVIDTFRKQMAQALGDDAAARYDLGVAYYEMGLYDEALSEFEAARPNAALRERSLEMMAACMAMQGRHAEILDLLAPALESPAAPDRVLGLRYSMGVACEALGRRDEARRHFEVVARIDSGYRDVRSRLQI